MDKSAIIRDMKLFLTSAGLVNKKLGEFFASMLGKKPADCSALMVALNRTSEDLRHTGEAKEELRGLGITKIEFFNLEDGKFADSGRLFDVVYACGGNTFAILERMKATGIFSFIKKAVNNNGAVYAGISAGSIIAGQSIEIAGWGSQGDKNEVGLKDFSGFGFTDISVYPHFYEELRKEVDEFKAKVGYPVVEIADYQAVYINNAGHKII